MTEEEIEKYLLSKTGRERIALGLDLSDETSWWMKHPNLGWVECECPCDACDASVFLRSQGLVPWPIRLGEPNDYNIDS